jgi:hypothetical protein
MITDPALIGTNVALDAMGNITAGSGLKLAIFNAVSITGSPTIPAVGSTAAPFNAQRPATQTDVNNLKKAAAQAKQLVADIVNGALLPVMQHIADHGEITVTILGTGDHPIGTGALQTSTAAGSVTDPPDIDVDLVGTIR